MVIGLIVSFALFGGCLGWFYRGKVSNFLALLLKGLGNHRSKNARKVPVSVNFHFTRQCNYECKFCFHTQSSSYVAPFEDVCVALTKLADAGMRKINFSGGEPFLEPKLLGKMVKLCKQDLNIDSVSIVSNGSKIKEDWLENYGQYVDILAISCDSFDDNTNVISGRRPRNYKGSGPVKYGGGARSQMEVLQRVAEWCMQYDIKFKLNTVVNTNNHLEDMNDRIEELNPYRWKVFQCLLLEGENCGDTAIRNATDMVVTKEQFDAFINRHKARRPIPEDNTTMKDSYLILNENLCFLNCTEGRKVPTKSLLEENVDALMDTCGFDKKSFLSRDGMYFQNTDDTASLCSSSNTHSTDIEDMFK
eukprot:m.1660 g.1660  ORF g.1660 m.1660 type:complete len:362 (+) comp1596_c0_seq1:41-1126(+)